MANLINVLFGRVTNMEKYINTMENTISNIKSKEKTKYVSWRTLDGSGNNLKNPEWGKTNINLLRQANSNYADGSSSLSVRGVNNPNPRIVSNLLCKTSLDIPNPNNLTDMMWIWGQFIDHEIDLTGTQSGTTPETADMITPDTITDPNEDYPNRTIKFTRSQAVINTDPREQPNNISSYIDGTNIYGYNTDRAYVLRKLDGSGKLKTGLADNGEELLIYNVNDLPNAAPSGSTPSDFFISGDIRANENIYLTAMHTLFAREHNRLCDEIMIDNPGYEEEEIYQSARKIVIGIMQYITYQYFLPYLLGNYESYPGYDNTINASIKTEFSTVGYRLGHSMLSSQLKTGNSGTILLRDAFFTPSYIQTNGIDNLLLGGSLGVMQKIDTRVVEDIRSFLFGSPTAQNLLDLAALNMQRGRDHGIPDYNSLRVAYGLSAVSNFADITTDTVISNGLASLYNTVNDIDPWIGALAEDHLVNSNVGPLLDKIIRDQFDRLRSGDRYYYKNDKSLTTEEIELIESSTLGKVMERNTVLTDLGDVFKL